MANISTAPLEGDSPERVSGRIRGRLANANAKRAPGHGASAEPPPDDPDAIADAIEEAVAHVESLKRGIAAQDRALARAEQQLASATPRQKPALEDEVADLKAARDNARQVLVLAEIAGERALERHREAERAACAIADQVTPRVDTIARSIDEAFKSIAESLQVLFAEGDAVRSLGIEIRAYCNRNAIVAAMHAAGLGLFANLPPVHDPKTLSAAAELWALNVRQRRGQLKQQKRN